MDDGCEAVRDHENLSRSPLVTGDGREAVSALDSGGGMGVFEKAVGGAARDEALLACRRCLAA